MSEVWKASLGLPEQLRWAVALEVGEVPRAGSALVIGMGGSGISGDFAAQAADRGGRLVDVHKGYGLPGRAAVQRPLVVAVSYSGDTEETLSGVEEARELGLPVTAISTGGELSRLAERHGWPWVSAPGGLQPRAAVGYLTGAVLRVLAAGGVLPDQRPVLVEAAALLDELLGPDEDGAAVELAGDLAEGLAGKVPVIYGGRGVAEVAAQRWKTQFNENAKIPAFWAVLPELDHNEIEGWAWSPARFGLVFLRDWDDDPRLGRRFELTAEALGGQPPLVGEVWAQGEGIVARMLSLAVVGDLTSVLMAELAGVDPDRVDVLEGIKRRMGEETSLPPRGRGGEGVSPPP
ncbi:MAG: bifunctional phosphoglucose/phosphomannose isomerase [Acidimicrobiia bacterium]